MNKKYNEVFSDEPLLDEDGILEEKSKLGTFNNQIWAWGRMKALGRTYAVGTDRTHINKKHHELDLICDLADPDAYVMALKKLIKEEK
tara:strand:+ start:2534 stop:2797 length:264 start_codon:yes stop_codon:yes gene_type:complete